MNLIIRNRSFTYYLFSFFVFGSLFPTLRVLLIGSSGSTNIYEFIISILPDLFLCALFIYSFIYFLKHSQYKELKPLDYVVLLYILGNTIIGVYYSDNLLFASYAFRLSYLPVFFYFIGRFYSNVNEQWLNYFFQLILYWLLGIALVGIVLYFFFPNLMLHMISLAGGRPMEYYIMRMTSIFWLPTSFASYMSIGILFSYYKLHKEPSIKYYLFFTLFWICLLFSVSRGPFILFFLGIIALTLIFKSWKPLLICIVIILVSSSIFSLTIDSFNQMILWILSSTSDTLMMKKGITRVELFNRTIEDLKHNPFGYGFGKAGMLARRFYAEDTPGVSYYSTDFWYLKLACETGIFGFISYITILLLFGIKALRHALRYKQGIFIFVFLFIILFNIENIVHNLPDYFLFAHFYWLTIGLLQNVIEKHNA